MSRAYLQRVLSFAGANASFRAKDIAEAYGDAPRSYSYILGRLSSLGVLEPEVRRHYYQRGPNWEDRKRILKSEGMYKKGHTLMVQRGRDLPPEIADRMEREWHCRKVREYGIEKWSAIVNKSPEILREIVT